eukprot:CAMPEP_0170797374 /NCGR_PEP_ID=MMETSP0733-20121128/25543_1 /TAXON_ID=186038 /ORGANISM="Fragilariopsis kerguelensis, Strain L26-C5" /LENGTH=39 /DNA_ID= /DNA_START= /DNA_END= /DNA_ORIENTATION=
MKIECMSLQLPLLKMMEDIDWNTTSFGGDMNNLRNLLFG